jgi:hypothetical protein
VSQATLAVKEMAILERALEHNPHSEALLFTLASSVLPRVRCTARFFCVLHSARLLRAAQRVSDACCTARVIGVLHSTPYPLLPSHCVHTLHPLISATAHARADSKPV